MKTAGQFALSSALFAAAVLAVRIGNPAWPAAFLIGGLCVHICLSRSAKQVAIQLAPILMFAGVLVLLQWWGGGVVTSVPLRTVAVFLLVTAGARLFPLDAVLRPIPPRSRLFHAALFLLLVRHFLRILAEEMVRLLRARSLAMPRRFGPGSLRSLAFAAASIFPRTLERAERFYACQLLRGLAD